MNEAAPKPTVTIKKYANRRLYNTATSTYVTLENLSAMVKEGTEFNVYDAKSGEDITRSVLTQIIVEEEGKSGQNLLPIGFLRQLIGFYGDNMQWMVPKYLEHSMQALSKNQEQMRGYFQNTFGTVFPFGSTLEEMGKQNMAMFERAMRMFSPFAAGGLASSMTNTMTDAAHAATDSMAATANSMTSTASAAAHKMTDTMATAAKTAGQAASKPASDEEDDVEPEPAGYAQNQPMKAETPRPMPVAVPMPQQQAQQPAASVTSFVRRSEPAAQPASFATGGTASPAYITASTPMPNVSTATAAQSVTADDMQTKISNLQRQLADLAKGRG